MTSSGAVVVMPKVLRRLRRTAVLVAAVVAGLFGAWRGFRCHVGSPRDRLADTWHVGTRVLDRGGDLLYFAPSAEGMRGTPASLREMGERIAIATLTAEDRRFYDHDGVDRRAALRAVVQAIVAQRIVSGASTITQQLVELLDSAGHPGADFVLDKLREIARAQNLEDALDKDEILEAYLNRVPFGHGIVGVGAAAQGYFGRSPAELSWAQAAVLAVIPRAPSALDPYKHLDRVLRRQKRLLLDLHRRGHLDDRELEEALWEPVRVETVSRPFRAPLLSLRAVERLAADPVPQAVVATSIDGAIQDRLEEILRRHLPRLRHASARQAAAIIVDNESGEVLAYAGSADWDDPEGGRFDMVEARRPAGSILKPFGYALAYQDGLRPTDLLADVPTVFPESSGIYTPQNIDMDFLGPLPAAEALALSRNVPAVFVGQRVGTDRLLASLREVGFRGLTQPADHYGAALILGSAEVSLWEAAEAYACLARSGDCISLTWSLTVESKPHRALSKPAAALVAENLSNPAWRVRFLEIGMAPARFDMPVATKTGTSQNHADTWAIAFSSRFTIAVWAGNDDGAPTRGLTGGTGAGPIAVELVSLVLTNWRRVAAPQPWWPTENLEVLEVCPISGLLTTEACPDTVERLFDPDRKPVSMCPMHKRGAVVRTAERGSAPRFSCSNAGRERAVVLPAAYQEWLEEQRGLSEGPGSYVDPYGSRWYLASESIDCEISLAPH